MASRDESESELLARHERARSGYMEWPEKRELALTQLAELRERGPSEESHYAADKVLLWLLDDPELSVAFESIERWYA